MVSCEKVPKSAPHPYLYIYISPYTPVGAINLESGRENSELFKTFDRSKKYFQTKKLEPIEVWRYSRKSRSFK